MQKCLTRADERIAESCEKPLKLVEKKSPHIQKANGYHGPHLHDYGEKRARALIRAGWEHFKIDAKILKETAKGDWRKGLLAAMIQAETTISWIGLASNLAWEQDREAAFWQPRRESASKSGKTGMLF